MIVLPIASQQGCKRVDDVLVAADHDRQPGLLRADVAAGDRRIDACTPLALAASAISTASDGSLVVMSTRIVARLAAGQRAVAAEDHLAHVARKADDGEDHVALLGDVPGRSGPGRALVEQRLGLALRAVIDGGGKALGDQVRAHALPHHAGADPAEARRAGNDFGDSHCVSSRVIASV